MTTRKKLLVALAAVLVAACGGSSPAATGQSSPTPATAGKSTPAAAPPAATTKLVCPLFAAADAQGVLGVPVGPGKEGDGERGCTYTSADSKRYASVVIKSASAYPNIAAAFAMKTSVSGVGDEAVRKSDGTSLLTHNSSISVLVGVNSTLADTKSSTAITAALVEIAKKVLAAA